MAALLPQLTFQFWKLMLPFKKNEQFCFVSDSYINKHLHIYPPQYIHCNIVQRHQTKSARPAVSYSTQQKPTSRLHHVRMCFAPLEDLSKDSGPADPLGPDPPLQAEVSEASGRVDQSAHPAGLHGAQDLPGPPGEPAPGLRLRPAHLERKDASS